MDKFVPRDIQTQAQMAGIILLDVISRYERGELDEDSAREELRRRLGWEPPRRGERVVPFN